MNKMNNITEKETNANELVFMLFLYAIDHDDIEFEEVTFINSLLNRGIIITFKLFIFPRIKFYIHLFFNKFFKKKNKK